MKKNIILGLFSLVLMASSAVANQINTVFVTTNTLSIPYVGIYPNVYKVKLGTYTLPWSQAGKSANIIATLPANIPDGTYQLNVEGQLWPVSVEIGSVRAAAALNARVDAEIARANSAEAGLTNGLNAEIARANGAEDGLTNAINTEVARANAAEDGLTNGLNAEITRANGAEAGLTNGLNAETARANAAEAGLTNGLNAEIARANGAEDGLTNAINAETARAQAAEAGLTNTITTVSNSIAASQAKDLSVVTVITSDSITNIYNSFIPLTTLTNGNNTTLSIIGDTNGWTAGAPYYYTIPTSGIYEFSFTFNVSYAPDSLNEIVIEKNGVNDTIFAFPAVNTGSYASWSGHTTIQCSAGDTVGLGPYTSAGDNVTCGPEPLATFALPVNVMQFSVKQLQ